MSTESPLPLPSNVLSSLNVAVLLHSDNGDFTLLGSRPEWISVIWPDLEHQKNLQLQKHSLFLEHFLFDANQHWASASDEWLSSGTWTETDPAGREWPLEAVVTTAGDAQYLLIKFPTTDHQTVQTILQEGRNQALEYGRLIKEINKREVLLHCIVHDLSTPLAGIKGSLLLLQEDDMVREEGESLLNIGLNQVRKMQDLIQEILASFAQEVRPLIPTMVSSENAPDAAECVNEVASVLNGIASHDKITIRVDQPKATASTKVIGDKSRLERVVFNLVDNALRHSPKDSEVVVRIRDNDQAVRVSVKDRGPGVDSALVPKLFGKFSQGASNYGKSGLGLYFCRITVEGWGGNVGYRPRKGGGSIFEFELPKPGQ